jgi:hypothetical protein
MDDLRANAFRRKRFQRFLSLLDRSPVSILDVGGTIAYWKSLGDLHQRNDVTITVVNIEVQSRSEGNVRVVRGNACSLSEYPDNAFDIVHSNSVIEHVGHWQEMQRMAAEIRRLAPAYFVQTPNVWFPIEPHFKAPVVHWLPEQARIRVLQALRKVPLDMGGATSAVQRIALLSRPQLAALFPDAEIWTERWMGLPKSLVAMRRAEPDTARPQA